MLTLQAKKMTSKYAPLVGIDQYGSGERTDELQYWNYGYWPEGTPDPKVASVNLLEKLLTLLPPPPAKILDVAFGQGGSTRALCELYGRQRVTGINIADDQVAHARASGVPCELIQMDAADLTFADATFDAILCMEAAFHFSTRLSFLKHAHRVLRPGGRLVMSDLLFRSGVGLDPVIFPPQNEVAGLDAYKALYGEAGFAAEDVSVEVITREQLSPFLGALAEYAGYLPTPDPARIQIDSPHAQNAILFILTRAINISDCVVVSATRR